MKALARSLAILAVLVIVPTFVLGIRNGSFGRDPTIFVMIPMIGGYVVVGALLALRLPRNAIGWLMLTAGLGLLLGGFWSEYAIYALVTEPDSLPFGLTAAWFQTWAFTGILVIPLLFLLFPTGHLPSRRWVPVFWSTIACIVLLGIAGAFAPGPIDITEEFQPENPLGVPALHGVWTAIAWGAGLGIAALALASVAALVLRFRRASGEERQQVRWLAFVGCLTGISLVVVLVTSIGVAEGEPSLVNDLSFLVFLFFLGIGIPVAIGVALLRYRLYELDLVIKKTAVFAVCAVLLMAAGVILAAVFVGPLTWWISDDFAAAAVYGFVLGLLVWPLWRLSRRVADRIVYGGRASPYEVLAEFSERMSESYATDDVLPRMARIIREATGARAATVWVTIGNEIRPEATTGDGDPEGPVPMSGDVLPTLPGDLAVEVCHQGALLGALAVTMPANDPMNPSKERLVGDLAAQAGLVVRNVRLFEELRGSRRRLVAAQDLERRKIERNIHDGAQQQLVAIQVKLRLAEQLATRDAARSVELLEQLQADAGAAIDDLRDLARGIYPPLLADQGLVSALQAQARKAAIPTTVRAEEIGRYPQEVEAAVYFACLEALQNTAKYADASHATIELERSNGSLSFRVDDDGRGFDASATRHGTGLPGMTDRLEAIGGELRVESAPGRGTTIRGTIRVPEGSASP